VRFREREKVFTAGLKPERVEICLRHDLASLIGEPFQHRIKSKRESTVVSVYRVPCGIARNSHHVC
jgi:hypothetical protein